MKTPSVISLATGSLALLFNLTLIPIIIKFSSPMIGAYKYLLLSYTCSAALYAILQILSLPTFHFFSRGYVFYGTTDYFARPVALVLLLAFASCYFQNLVIIGLSFLYRYGIMCSQAVLSWFHSPTRLLFLIAAWCVTPIVTMILVLRVTPDFVDNKDILHEMVLNETGMNLWETAYISGFVYLPSGKINHDLIMAMIGVTSCITITASVAGFCIYRMQREIKQAPKSVQIQYHRKLLILLLLQASFPFLTNALPLLLVMSCSLFGYSSHYVADYLGSLLSIAQIVDPILVITFIKDYRTNFFRIFGLAKSPQPLRYRSSTMNNMNDLNV